MNILKWFRKKTFAPAPISTSTGNVSAIYLQQTAAFRQVFDHEFIQFYSAIEPCSDGIDRISEAAAHVKMQIKDQAGSFVDNSEIDAFIEKPNPVLTWDDIQEAFMKFFLITGNAYLLVTRSSGGKMLEIFPIEPQHITVSLDTSFFIATYTYNNFNGFGRLRFDRSEDNGQIRYFTRDMTKELYHLKRFNPVELQTRAIGQSLLRSIVYELSLDQAGSIHNLSLLQNGGSIGGILQVDPKRTNPDKMANLVAEFENKFQGARNAGRFLISSAIEKYIDTMQNNKDMEFQNMKAMITERIYQRYKIPLALIQSTGLSLTNMTQAQLQFYQNAICPLLSKDYAFLTTIFRDYFKSFASQRFDYDPFTIDALRQKQLEELQLQSNLNVSSDNELRNKLDLPPYENGDEIYKPTTMLPVGETDPDST